MKLVRRSAVSIDRPWLWLAAVCVPLALLIAVKGILLPFVIGMLAAYFLGPAVDKLLSFGASRGVAALSIVGIFFVAIGVVLTLVLPLLFGQITDFAGALPGYVNNLQERYGPHLQALFSRVEHSGNAMGLVHKALDSLSASGLSVVTESASGLVRSGFALVDVFALIFVTPVVAFYMLRDWHVIVAKVSALVPRRYVRVCRTQAREVDRVLSGFVRGQTNVCLFLAVFYSIALTVAGLHYGLALGLAVGLLTFIPYVGSLFGLVCGPLLAFVQTSDFSYAAVVAAIFVCGQFVESNFIAPRFVGERVGLHPVWIIFGLLVGGNLFGFMGVLIAVPVTAVAGVFVRFGMKRYQKSAYFAHAKRSHA